MIPEPDDQKAHRERRGSRGGRPVTYDRNAYHGRNVIERAFNGFKHWRGLATRYDKHATVYRGAIVLAAALLGINDLSGVVASVLGPLIGRPNIARSANPFGCKHSDPQDPAPLPITRHLAWLVQVALVYALQGVPVGITLEDREPCAVWGFTVAGGRLVEIDAVTDPDRPRRLGVSSVCLRRSTGHCPK